MKKKNKHIKELRAVLYLSMVITIMVVVFKTVGCTRQKLYEYYTNGKVGTSGNCYQTEQIECYCKINGVFQKVDNYYTK